MRLDHVSFAAGPEGLDATVARLSTALGCSFAEGGFHPRFGTKNAIVALADGTYLEVVAVLDHPAADKAPFGQAVRQRSETGGGWLSWVVAVDDLAAVEQRLGREAVDGSRHRPDGALLEWKQLGVKNLQADPQLPFFVHWLSEPSRHPSVGGGSIRIVQLEIAGYPERVDDWLGGHTAAVLSGVDVEWSAPNGPPGLQAVVFDTPGGRVRV